MHERLIGGYERSNVSSLDLKRVHKEVLNPKYEKKAAKIWQLGTSNLCLLFGP